MVFLLRLQPVFYLICLALFLGACLFPVSDAWAARKKKAQAIDESRKYAAIVLDADTGEILMSAGPDKQVHPASLTKMMTLLLAFDALSEKRMRTSDYIRISNHAASMSPSKLGIQAGGRIRVDDAIRAISVKSANDIAAAMAEALSGSEDRFAQKMTARAREIGMSHTQFVNASGLHSPFQITTARDMALLGRYIISHYPGYYRYFALRSFSYAGRTHPNHNKLMNRYPGMDGMKTGYISQSGFNLVASVKRGDRRLIGVVFGGRTARSRDDHMENILNNAFAKPPKLAKPKIDTTKLSSISTDPDLKIPAFDARPVTGLQPIEPEAITPIPNTSSSDDEDELDRDIAIPPRKPVLAPAAGVIVAPEPPRASQTLGQLPADPPASNGHDYTVQIGAYQSRDATDRALYTAAKKLPRDLRHASPVVAPLKSVESGWLFRARLGNLTKSEANRVCKLFKSCLVLAPEKF